MTTRKPRTKKPTPEWHELGNSGCTWGYGYIGADGKRRAYAMVSYWPDFKAWRFTVYYKGWSRQGFRPTQTAAIQYAESLIKL